MVENGGEGKGRDGCCLKVRELGQVTSRKGRCSFLPSKRFLWPKTNVRDDVKIQIVATAAVCSRSQKVATSLCQLKQI